MALQALAKSFEAADLPSRCAKFVPRKQWVAIGSDDMHIRIFNYNTMEREKAFEVRQITLCTAYTTERRMCLLFAVVMAYLVC